MTTQAHKTVRIPITANPGAMWLGILRRHDGHSLVCIHTSQGFSFPR